MSLVDDVVGVVTGYSKIAIVVMVLLTVAIGAGAPMVEQTSSLDQFQSDTPEAEASEYIEGNFSTGPKNTTFVQVIVRGDNVLSQSALVDSLEYQQRLRANQTVNNTLVANQSTVGVANILSSVALQQEVLRDGQQTLSSYDFITLSGEPGFGMLQQAGAQIQQRNASLNQTRVGLQGGLRTIQQDRNASISAVFQRTNANTPVELGTDDQQAFERAARDLRNATTREQVNASYRAGTLGVLRDEYETLGAAGADLQAVQQRLEGTQSASLDRQKAAIQSLSEERLDSIVETVLSGENPQIGDAALRFLPAGGYYDPGSTTANATMILVTQRTDSPSVGGGTATQRITDAQLAMQALSDSAGNGLEFVVFGSGIITDEINQSMTDSMTIVGPMALLFVLVALILGYRDALDIILGLVGIVAVLVWTFGFMGWLNIDFNQIFIAVPVLLIGLSIDYAIHIFMRHREERYVTDGDDLRASMRTALGGVGVALALVTATTVIGFMSNLISPLPPIQDFGVVSSFGIVAAFLVFGVLTPALKVEIDGFLENRGIDRKKRAIGTGGGRLSNILKVGSIGARKSAVVVILLALLISAGGVYGATQVDTSFSQSDFLAEDPADWLKDLPEPFAPGDYTAKENLEYVNERFAREDSQASILVRGDVTAAGTLDRLQDAQVQAADSDVTQRLPNGAASITTPLSVINATKRNGTFEALVTRPDIDTDGDGIPDENLTAVYDALFETAPQQAGQVLSRTDDGEYEAARFVVTIKGTASGADTTEEMRAVAGSIEGDGLRAIATGQSVLFEIVQQQLLDTVIESLLITLVAIIAFLMVVYRITDGSATLGLVTLIPVVLSVSWILGTMYLLGIPFNVLTGMITSLTVGLGVAYSIHLSERYNQELERNGSAWDALDRSVTGTGGALLGSAATTVGGFGTLAFALLPSLQQFGIITGLTIIYAFLASVLVLPSLLVVWTRYVGPAEKLSPDTTGETAGDSVPTDD